MEHGGDGGGAFRRLEKDPVRVTAWKRNLRQRSNHRVVGVDAYHGPCNHSWIPKDRHSTFHAKDYPFDCIDLGLGSCFEESSTTQSNDVTMLLVRMEMGIAQIYQQLFLFAGIVRDFVHYLT